MDQAKILKLIDEALVAAHTAGMEDAAEMEGVSWTGTSSEVEEAKADTAREALLEALGISS